MGKRKQTHLASDQFGEVFGQDKDDRVQPTGSGRGGTGGGTAGSTRTGPNISFERRVPKFLQPYAHMLGKGRKNEEDPVTLNEPETVEDEEQVEAEAIQRALADNPELAAEVGDKFSKQVEAQAEKDLGNTAFGKKDYTTAITHFSRCIELNPEKECRRNEVYYSNRSAAHAGLGDYDVALDDARKVVSLRPGWVKGWARLAAAHFGLKQYSDAKDAYERALRYEPDDYALQKGLEKATVLELQQVKDHKHVFKKRRQDSSQRSRGPSQGGGSSSKDKKEAGGKVMLSFDVDDGDE